MITRKKEKTESLKLITVNGEVNSDDVNIMSPHEHVLIDIRNQFSEFKEITLRKQSEQQVTIEKLGALSRNPYAVKDNLVMDDEERVSDVPSTIIDLTKPGDGVPFTVIREGAFSLEELKRLWKESEFDLPENGE